MGAIYYELLSSSSGKKKYKTENVKTKMELKKKLQ